MFLDDSQFDELIFDIKQEILFRQNKITDTEIQSSEYSLKRIRSKRKINRLSNDKFENLVIDALLVYKHRNKQEIPLEHKKIDEIEALIVDLENVIQKMKKSELNETEVIQRIQDEIKPEKKFDIYNTYLLNVFKKHKLNCDTILYMSQNTSKMLRHRDPSLTYFCNPHHLLVVGDRHFDDADEYVFHKLNIQQLQESNLVDNKLKQKLIKKEMVQIYSMIIDEQLKEKELKNIESIDKEVEIIIKKLEEVKVCYENNTQREYSSIAEEVVSACDDLLHKIDQIEDLDQSLIYKLSYEKKNLEVVLSNKEHQEIPNMVFDIASLVKTILYCLPIPEI
ncbi:hypothetical protein BDAP_000058 [Binucleata daphniae]